MGLNPITFGTLLQKVASRLNRDDLDSVIREVARERIAYYGDEVYYACQFYDHSITTTPGQNFYDIPSGWEQLNSVRILQGTATTGIWLTLREMDYEFINDLDNLEPPLRSIPAYWCLFGSPLTPGQSTRALRLWPTPGTTYLVELSMDRAPAIPADDAVNFWSDDAGNLILYATCAEMCRVHISNPLKKIEFDEAEGRERRSLESKSIRSRSGGIQIRPYL